MLIFLLIFYRLQIHLKNIYFPSQSTSHTPASAPYNAVAAILIRVFFYIFACYIAAMISIPKVYYHTEGMFTALLKDYDDKYTENSKK